MINLIEYIDDFKLKSLKSFLKEQYEIEKMNYWDFINEDNYKYPDQEKFIATLAKNAYWYFNKYPNKDELKTKKELLNKLNFKNIFFDNVEIHLVDNKQITGGYLPKKSNLTDENKFDLIYINIDKSKTKNLNDLCRILMHEFTHARQHYSGIIRGKKTLEDLSGKNSSYAKTLVGTSDPEILCKEILNKLYKFEQSAYLSELHFAVDYKHCQDEDDIIANIKQSDTYKLFEELYYSTHASENLTSDQKQIFVNVYNDIKNSNLNFIKIRKKLLDKLSKFLNKIVSVAIDILHEYWDKTQNINENFIIPQDNIYYIKYLNDSLHINKNINWFE